MRQSQYKKSLEAFLDYHYSKETANSYARHIDKFKLQFPNYKKLDLNTIENYIADLKESGASVDYRRVKLAAIKALYRYLKETKQIKHHPCPRFFIKEKQQTGKDFDAMLSVQEMEELFALRDERYGALRLRNKVLIGLMIYQGLRSRELIQLRIKDVDLDTGVVTIRKGRNSNGRKLQLKPSQMASMIAYINEGRKLLNSSKFDVLILSKLGAALTVEGLCSFFNSMQCAFNKSLTPKNIRASVISYWLNDRKIPLEDVQIMAGHRYPSSTEKYVRPDSDAQRDVLNRLHENIFR